MHDLVVRGGTVVDGTGAAARRADVAIDRGRITVVGDLDERGREELDASNRIVMPGVVDPHTHLDAQLCWDSDAAPSSMHGVTTVLMGMCGFGIAPCPPGGGDYLLRSLERVEEIPFECSSLGVHFEWSTWAEFLAHLESRSPAVNFGGMVPHSSLRYYVMGDRAREAPANPAERAALAQELRRSLDAGALGFATSRGPNHVDAFGRPVPSRFADDDELRALVMECAGRPWQLNLEAKLSPTAEPIIAEVDRFARLTCEAGARLTWSPFFPEPTEAVWREVLAHHRGLNLDGTVTIRPQVSPSPLTHVLGFDGPRVGDVAGWHEAMAGFAGLDHQARLARLRDRALRDAIDAAPRVFAQRGAERRGMFAAPPLYDRWVVIGTTRPETVGLTVAQAAARAGAAIGDYLCDLVIGDDLGTRLQIPVVNADPDAAAALIGDDMTLIGLGDSGAHVANVSTYTYPTDLLARVVRDEHRLTLEDAVRRITSLPAQFFGVPGRGVLSPGWAADLCVVDLERLALGPVSLRHDLPGGSPRLFVEGVGYDAVVVNGAVTRRDGRATGVRPGEAVRADASGVGGAGVSV